MSVVYSTFHFHLATLYSFGFQPLQNKQVAVFNVGINPMDKALGLRSLPPYREDGTWFTFFATSQGGHHPQLELEPMLAHVNFCKKFCDLVNLVLTGKLC
jgi:hypothetical protein